jgi:hypothetical protein
MTKRLLCNIAIAAMTCFVLALRAQDSTDQSQYPTILQQPVDQCLPLGSQVTFSVVASNVDSYQWYKNNTAIDGQTNTSLTIASAQISDVAYYSAAVIKGADAVPTRMANLNVYTTSGSTSSTTTTTSKFRFSSTQSTSTMSAMDLGGGGTITVFGAPICNSGSSGSCPGAYSGYVLFSRTLSQGWGWAPTAGATTLTVADMNRSDTKVQSSGKSGDVYCGLSTLDIPVPAYSPKYRFTIFFPPGVQVPTNAYPITLTGFDP